MGATRFSRLPSSRWFYRALILAAPLSLVALIAGWITTEVGRQPWIAYQVMRTEQAVTAADGLTLGYAFLVAVYVALGAAVVWLLRRLSRQNRNRPDAITIAEPSSSATVGRSPQTAKPSSIAQTS